MNRTSIDDPQQPPPRAQERGQEFAGRRGYRRDGGSAGHRAIEMDRLRDVGRNLSEQIDEQVHKRPYVALGAAAGIGFVAGSILGSRLGQVLLAAGVGYAAKQLLGGEFGLDRLKAGLEELTGEVDSRTERGSGRT